MKKLTQIVSLVAALAVSVCTLASCGETAKKVESIKDLEGAKIGVQLGTTGDIYASDVKGAKLSKFSKAPDAILALTSGKIDCVIIDNEPAKKFVEENKGLKILEEPFANEDYAIAIAKDNTELLDNVNNALKELKEEGVIDQIVKNFIGEAAGTCPYVSPEGVDTSKGTLVMGTNAAFQPYEYKGENGEITGIDAQIAHAICDKLGYKLEIQDMEFSSIIGAVESHKIDFGMAGMTVTDERLEKINFSDTYATGVQVIIVKE